MELERDDDFSMLSADMAKEEHQAEDTSVPFTAGEAATTVTGSALPARPSQQAGIHPGARLQLFEQEDCPSHAEGPSGEDTEMPSIVKLKLFHSDDMSKEVAGPAPPESDLPSVMSLDSVGPPPAACGQKQNMYLVTDPQDGDGGDVQNPVTDPQDGEGGDMQNPVTDPQDGDGGDVQNSQGVVPPDDAEPETSSAAHGQSSNPVAVQRSENGQVSIKFLSPQSGFQNKEQRPYTPDEPKEHPNLMADRNSESSKFAQFDNDDQSTSQSCLGAWENKGTDTDTDQVGTEGLDCEKDHAKTVSHDDSNANQAIGSPYPEQLVDQTTEGESADADIDKEDFPVQQACMAREGDEMTGDDARQHHAGDRTAVFSKAPILSAVRPDDSTEESRMQNEGTQNCPTEDSRTERDSRSEEDEEEGKEEEISGIVQVDKDEQFSTPRSSPAFSNKPMEMVGNAENSAANMTAEGGGNANRGMPTLQEKWGAAPGTRFTPQVKQVAELRGSPGYAQVGRAPEQQRGMSPQRMMSPHRMTTAPLMQGGQESEDGSAFRPVPQRPVHGPLRPSAGHSPSAQLHVSQSAREGGERISPCMRQSPHGYDTRQNPSQQQYHPGQRMNQSPSLLPEQSLREHHASHSPSAEHPQNPPAGLPQPPSGLPPSVYQQQQRTGHPAQSQGGQQHPQYAWYQQQQMYNYQQQMYYQQLWQQQQQQQGPWLQHQQPDGQFNSLATAPSIPYGHPSQMGVPYLGYWSPQAPGAAGQYGVAPGQEQLGYGPGQPPSSAQHPGDTMVADTVRVTGVDHTTDLEMLRYYFESPKKSGGDAVRDVVDHRSEGYALVTFENPAVVPFVVQRTHVVSKKSLTVTVEQKKEQQPEEFPCTVQVSGGSVVLNDELMELYFENTGKSGGGKIAKMEVIANAGMTLITFEEQKVAEAVLNRPHVVSQTTLKVVPYRPAKAPNKVKVTGLSPKVGKELLKEYFENKGQCAVQEVQLDKSRGEAVVTFADPEAVQTVLALKHKLSGQQFAVSVLTATDTAPDTSAAGTENSGAGVEACTVEVWGLAAITTEETIQFYFENKRRSGGGDVKEVRYVPGSGVATVTFEDAEVAQSVLKNQHKLEGYDLKVSLCTPGTTFDPADPSKAEETQALTTVCVRGLTTSVSHDFLLNYFENHRRSGGGEVTDITPDSKKGVCYVTFKNAADAARVASRSHTIERQQAQVQLYKPPEMCKDRVLLRNLPELRNADELETFVDLRTDQRVKSIWFAEEEGTAVVIFESDVDMQTVRTCVTKKPFKQTMVTVETIPVSSTVLVCDLPEYPPVTEDMLVFYFENVRRSDGGNVLEARLDSGHALLTFEDQNVAARVANRPHKLQNHPVTVCLYMECLGISGGSREPTAQIPTPLPLSAEDCQKICDLKVLSERYPDLEEALKNQYARLEDRNAEPMCIVCLLTADIEGVRQMAKVWTENVQQVLHDHLKDIYARHLTVSEEELAEAQSNLDQLTAETPEAGYTFDPDKNQLLIVSKGDMQRNIVDKLEAVVREAQRKLERKKRRKSQQMKIDCGKLLLLQKSGKLQCMLDEFPDVDLKSHDDPGCLELVGPVEEVCSVEVKLYEIADSIVYASHRWESDFQKELMQKHKAARVKVESLCAQAGPEEVVEFLPDGFNVYSFDARRAEAVQVRAIATVQKRVIKFTDDNQKATELQEWEELKEAVLRDNEGLMILEENQACLTLVSVSESVQQDFVQLRNFLLENTVQEHTFPLPVCLHNIFRQYLQKKVIDMQFTLSGSQVIYREDHVVVTGTSQVIDAAQNIYASFRETLTQEAKTFTQPSLKELFATNEWIHKRDDIERTHQCLVLDPEEIQGCFLEELSQKPRNVSPVGPWHQAREQELSFPGQTLKREESYIRGAAPPMPAAASGVLPKHRAGTRPRQPSGPPAGAEGGVPAPQIDLPTRPRLYLSVMTDITKEEHNVLVNSSNTTLNMSNGQVAKALLEVGGVEIQEELKASYPQGLSMGGIAITGAGKLMCNKLIHCCLPEEKDEEKMALAVQEAVTKCLVETEKLGLTSIGFPSLGTGNLKYPVPLVARTMFKSALDYGRQHRNTCISDVFFILHKKDQELTRVFRGEYETYREMSLAAASAQRQEEDEPSYDPEPTAKGIESYNFFQETKERVKKLFVGLDQRAVDEAKKEVMTFYHDSVTSIVHSAPDLQLWDDKHKQTIIMACKAVNVDLTLNFTLSKISLHGFREMMGRIPVHRTLKDAEADVAMKRNAKLVQKQVQWSCIEIASDGEHLVPYDMNNNYKIEMAYQNGEEKVMIVDNNNVALIISFARMQEIPENHEEEDDDAAALTIIRQDKIHTLDVPVPQTWLDMKGDLDVKDLDPISAEYQGVAPKFQKSLERPCKIVKIQRVQNLTLYKQYHALKRQMESTVNPEKCERLQLWHGTRGEAVQGIIKYGFNRSYSNQQKSNYGQGAYFAVSASYSSHNEYAVASQHTQERHIFMCRVLVGEYRKGSKTMRIPPVISDGVRCHSTVDDEDNPEIFVTYSDVQAYPDYLIVFKDN